MNHMTSSTRYSDKLKFFTDEQNSPGQVDDFLEKEWRIHISKLAWQSIKNNYDENMQNAFELISQGKSNTEVAEKLNLKPNTVAVYKKRVIEALRIEIRRLDSFLS